MGNEKKYRWDKRRDRRRSQDRDRAFKSFWGFEIILLILIFALGLIMARIVVLYAFNVSACLEAIAAFGADREDTRTAFDYMIWVVVLLFGFWLALSLHFWKVIRHSKSALVHLALFLSICLLGAHFRMLQVGHNNPPDGSLAIREQL
jgi:glucan phosphoethanolaminetransferase (alkaline phosphatase superfamily)